MKIQNDILSLTEFNSKKYDTGRVFVLKSILTECFTLKKLSVSYLGLTKVDLKILLKNSISFHLQ
jgi:hypothetical protein